jgi:hypothetical protein
MRSLHRGLICRSLLCTVFGIAVVSAAQTSSTMAAGAHSNVDRGSTEARAASTHAVLVDEGAATSPPGNEALAGLPESPGAVQFSAPTQSGSLYSILPISQTAQTPSNTEAAPPQNQSPATNSSSNPQQPVGTAAAPAPVVTGTAAARPAGVAVAPGKQHRVRTIVIRVGAIAGAAVALGTVVALSEATSSRPPGAH